MEQSLALDLRALKTGNREAMRSIYAKSGARVFGLARHHLGQDQLARECVEQVYSRAWKERETLPEGEASFLVWLSKTVRDVATTMPAYRLLAKDAQTHAAELPLINDIPAWRLLSEANQSLLYKAYVEGVPLEELAVQRNMDANEVLHLITRLITQLGEQR